MQGHLLLDTTTGLMAAAGPDAATPSIEAMFVRFLCKNDVNRIDNVIAPIMKNPCPKDPALRFLLVALLDSLSTKSDLAGRKAAILDQMARCGPPWKVAAEQWRDAQGPRTDTRH